jgi:tetratricopeptide (TPR) repeat protein
MLALAGSAADWESASAPEPPLWDTPALLGASWDDDLDALVLAPEQERAETPETRGGAIDLPAPPGIDWEAIEPLDPAAELPPVDLDTGAPAPVDPELPAAVTSLDPTAGRDGPGPDAMPAELVYGDIVLEVAVPVELPPTAADTPPEDGLDLGAWLRATEPARSTRLIAPVLAPTGDEEADFRATLAAFRAGVASNLDAGDHDSRYDLGVAYKEMGLLEEAIGEFQKAARAPGHPLRALEALAQCFLDRDEPELARSALAPVAAEVPGVGLVGDASLVGVYYLLGAACERVGRTDEARDWYVRVLATDYQFRDAASRLASLPTPRR